MTDKQKGLLQANGLIPQPYICYTAAACDNMYEPHIGSAAYLVYDPEGVEYRQAVTGKSGTKNNRCEMMAIICAIGHLPEGSSAFIKTASKYCITAFTKGSSANEDLVKLYHKYEKRLSDVTLEWIKGDTDDPSRKYVTGLAKNKYRELCEANNAKVNNYVINGYQK